MHVPFYYPHMPIGKVWTYRLLLVFSVCVSTVKDFSGKDKASDIKFCMAVHQRPGQGLTHFEEFCSPEAQKLDESARGSKKC